MLHSLKSRLFPACGRLGNHQRVFSSYANFDHFNPKESLKFEPPVLIVPCEAKLNTNYLMTLNRPKKHNALNLQMIHSIVPYFRQLLGAQVSSVIVIQGGGDVFCAGHDIYSLHEMHQEGAPLDKILHALKEENELGMMLSKLPNETCCTVTMMDGLTQGSGISFAINGQFSVATERTKLSFSEVHMGYFPAMGSSFVLPKLEDGIGAWLALTGSELKGHDVFRANLATHFVPHNKISFLVERLMEAELDLAGYETTLQIVERILGAQCEGHLLSEEEDPETVLGPSVRGAIKRCFGNEHNTVDNVMDALKAEEEEPEWATRQLELLDRASPTALKVVLRQLHEGAWLENREGCSEMEMGIAREFMSRHDVFEGIRAILVDKDRFPKWRPSALEDVTESDLALFFRAVPGTCMWYGQT